MPNQTARQQARRAALDAQTRMRQARAEQERRRSALAVTVVTALAERDALVLACEARAGEALRTLTGQEGLSLREAVACGAARAVRIDPAARVVMIGGEPVNLTAKEFDLLLQFASHPGRVYTRSQLLDSVWGYGHDGYEHTVNSHINRLRAKIEKDSAKPDFILTVWGVGYKFCELEGSGLKD